MNKNILIVLGGAVAIALVVAVLVQVTLGGRKEPPQPVVVEKKTEVLVAAKDLKLGQELKEGDLKWAAWSEDSVFPGVIKRQGEQLATEALKGRIARSFKAGEPVVQGSLLSEKGNIVAASLDLGMRAVSVNVSAASMVSGFVGPGDRVDILLTYRETIEAKDNDPAIEQMIELNLDKLATETILQNVKVLAVDQTARRPDEEQAKLGQTVTLAVSLQDAERLSLAQQLGTLTLTLRGPEDDRIVENFWPAVSDARLTRINDEILEEYRRLKFGSFEKPTGIKDQNMRIYKGASVEVVSTK